MERERQRKREQERRRREAQVNKLTISNVVQMFIMHELSEGIYQEKTEQCVRGTKRGGFSMDKPVPTKSIFSLSMYTVQPLVLTIIDPGQGGVVPGTHTFFRPSVLNKGSVLDRFT